MGCLHELEVSCSDGKKVIWEVVDAHVVEGTKDNNDIGLIFFKNEEKGEGGEYEKD